jgi:hypothetical protein
VHKHKFDLHLEAAFLGRDEPANRFASFTTTLTKRNKKGVNSWQQNDCHEILGCEAREERHRQSPLSDGK